MQYYYRNRIDIIVAILDTANGNEVRQIEILSKANITHTVFKEYLFFILQYGLIEFVRHQRTYRTTAKGLDFLSIYSKMKALILPLPDLSESSIPIKSKKNLNRPRLKKVLWYSTGIMFLHLFQIIQANFLV
jgi:predicted transcriptional regulator